jgi:hypothetical protein
MLGKVCVFVEKYLVCPENFLGVVRKILSNAVVDMSGKNVLGMSGKKILVTSPPTPRSPTILGRNINVQFACSGNLYCMCPPNKIRPRRPWYCIVVYFNFQYSIY